MPWRPFRTRRPAGRGRHPRCWRSPQLSPPRGASSAPRRPSPGQCGRCARRRGPATPRCPDRSPASRRARPGRSPMTRPVGHVPRRPEPVPARTKSSSHHPVSAYATRSCGADRLTISRVACNTGLFSCHWQVAGRNSSLRNDQVPHWREQIPGSGRAIGLLRTRSPRDGRGVLLLPVPLELLTSGLVKSLVVPMRASARTVARRSLDRPDIRIWAGGGTRRQFLGTM